MSTYADILVETVIRIGSNPAKAKAEAFLEELRGLTQNHPFNHSLRVLSGAMIDVSYFDGAIRIGDIQAFEPGKGGGTEALALLCRLADKHDLKLTLTAKAYSDDRLSTAQLKAWYERYGFHVEEDSFGDDSEGWDMVRYPNTN